MFNRLLMKHKPFAAALVFSLATLSEIGFSGENLMFCIALFCYLWGWFSLLERYQDVFFLEIVLFIGGSLLPLFLIVRWLN